MATTPIVCLAAGGSGGASLVGGAGGAAAACIGDAAFAGGTGGAGRSATGTTTGAGGGSSAGTAANGNVGATSLAGGAGGAAPTGGFAGGSGGGAAAGNGGGGSGGGSTSGAFTNGSAGGKGQAIVDGTSYTTAGTFTHTVAAGHTSIVIECWGSGGGGQSGVTNVSAGAGGGGGAYAKTTLAVTPGQTLTVVVAAVGNGGNTSGVAGFNGAATSVSLSSPNVAVLAAGATGGGQAGGTTAASVGTTLFAGGAGVATTGSGSQPGGGGGSSAGTAANGNAGATPAAGGAGGAAPTGGFAGGSGVGLAVGGSGAAGGGGGAGGGVNGGTQQLGGNGGAGRAVVDGTVYSAPGTFMHTVAAGVTSIVIECWGAGASGAQGGLGSTGQSGGGGAYAKSTATVTPGDKLNVIVGAGGVAIASGSTQAGGATSVAAAGPPFTFPGSAQGWVFNAGGGTGLTGAVDTATADSPNDAAAINGSLSARRDGKSLSTGTPYWEWTGTWEDLGVPAGSLVSAVDLDYDWQCSLYTTGASSSVGPAELRDGAGTLRSTISTAPTAVTATSAWATRDGTNVTGLSDPSDMPIKLRIGAKPNTGSSTSAAVVMLLDYVRVNITYAPVAAPVGPARGWQNEAQLSSEYGSVVTTGGTAALSATRSHSGASSLRVNRTSAANVFAQGNFDWYGSRKNCGSFWIYVVSLPTVTIPIFGVVFATSNNIEIRLSPTGQVTVARGSGGAASAASATTVTTGSWVRISWWANSYTGTFVGQAAVGSDTPVQISWAQAAETATALAFGTTVTTASLYDIYYDDQFTYVGAILPSDPVPDTTFPSSGAALLDDFNRANVGPPPSASWSTDIRGQAKPGMRVLSNELAAASGAPAECSTYWNAASFGADEDVFVTQKAGGDFSLFQLWARANGAGTAGVTAYVLNVFHGGFNFQRYEGSAWVDLCSGITHTFNIGWIIGFRVRGTALECWAKAPAGSWTLVAREYDAKLASGSRVGLQLTDANLTYDDFSAGTYVAAPSGTTTPISVGGTITPGPSADAYSIGKGVGGASSPPHGLVTPAGALARVIGKGLGSASSPPSGSITPAGSLRKVVTKGAPLTGAITPGGALAATRAFLRAFAGTVTPGPSALKQALTRTLTGAVTPAGAEARSTAKKPTGAVSPVGALAKSIPRTLVGFITPTGALAASKAFVRAFAGTVTPAATLLRQTVFRKTGQVAPAAAALRFALGKLAGGVVTPGGVETRAMTVAAPRGGTIAPAGAESKQTGKKPTGAVSPAGAEVRATTKGAPLTGTVAPAGAETRQTAVRKTGTITPAGALAALRTVVKALAGTITSVGADVVVKLTGTFPLSLSGSVTPVGLVGRSTKRLLVALLAPAAVATKRWTPVAGKLGGSIGAPFRPDALTGLSVWIDFAGATFDGSQITSWGHGGYAPDATVEGSDTGTPTWEKNELNGLSVARFSANGGRMRIAGTGVTTDWTLAYVARMRGPVPGRIVTASYPPNNLLVGWWNSFQDAMYDAGFTTPDVKVAWTTDWKLYSADGVPGLSRLLLDGVLLGATTTAAGWGGTFGISGYNATTTDESCDCDVAEVVLYDHALSDAQRAQVEGYLRDKWFGAGVGSGGELAGGTTLSTGKKLAAVLTPTASATVVALAHTIAVSLTAALAPAGSIVKRAMTKTAGGSLAPVGVVTPIRGFLVAVGGALASAGLLRRSTGKPTAGTVASSGTEAHSTGKLVAGTATPAGAETRQTTKKASGSTGPAGVLRASTGKALAATITPVASLTRSTGKALAGLLAAAGVEVRSTTKKALGAVTPGAVIGISRASLMSIGGVLSSIGNMKRSTGRLAAGAVQPASVETRSTGTKITAAVAPAGAETRSTTHAMAGTITPHGALAAARAYIRALSGLLAPAATMLRSTAKPLAGSAAPVGALTRSTGRRMTAALPVGGVTVVSHAVRLLAGGALSPVSVLGRSTGKALGGLVAPAGSIRRALATRLAGLLGLSSTAVVLPSAKVALSGIPSGLVFGQVTPFSIISVVEGVEALAQVTGGVQASVLVVTGGVDSPVAADGVHAGVTVANGATATVETGGVRVG